MNIFMVGEFYEPNLIGGAEIQAMRRAQGLVRLGINVTVLSFDSDKGKVEETINGVRIIRYHVKTHKAKMLSLSIPIAKALARHQQEADIFHLYNTHPLPGGGLYKVTGGKKKVVATLENYSGFCPVSTAMYGRCDLHCRYSCLRRSSNTAVEKIIAIPYSCSYPFLGMLSKRLDRYLAVSEYVRKEYISHGFQASRIEVLPNSINVDSYAKTPREPHDGVNILYVGRMSQEKGVETLMKAFQRVSRTYENTRLLLVGDGPFLNRCRLLAREIGVETSVVFTGHLGHEMLDYYYSIADVFVHPALFHEPFNLTLLEAMAHDIPILVSNVGSLSNIVKDAGIAFDMGNVEDLVDKLSFLIADSARMNTLARKCKPVLAEYDDSRVLGTLVRMYESMIDN